MKPKSYQTAARGKANKAWTAVAVVCTMMMLAACGPTREPAVDAALDAEIQKIRAIDHHAHPARVTAKGEPPDRGFDALPVDNMEPMSDPLIFRPSNPAWGAANRALFGSQNKQQTIDAKGEQYPAWVLDQIGVDIMFANRVELGSSVQPPRFRWVAFADALMFPLDTTKLGERNSDRKSFFVLEDALRKKYLDAAGLTAPPATLAEYLSRVVTPTLERHKQGGALAEKFEAAYLRTLSFDKVDRATADRIYGSRNVLAEAEYKPLQDFLFRYIAAECGRLGMAVHIHTGEGAGSYYDVQGANPLQLESVLSDPELRKTNFVMVHGGWPFVHQAAALLIKPNAYLDFSMQPMLLSPATVAGHLREWLEFVPEKVMFGTDAYPFSPEMGWEEAGWVASRNARQALALALTAMLRDGSITRERAVELARMVLRDNARKLYAL